MVGPNPRAGELRLSVVVVVFAGGDCLERCLRALRTQDGLAEPPEIIVAHEGPLGREEEAAVQGGGIRVISARAGSPPAHLRALACAVATRDVIACTEDHCVPARDWCSQILDAHRMPHAAIGGAVEKLTPDSSLSWAGYFCDFARYMPPLREGVAATLTDCNVTYKRTALLEIRDVWQDEFLETQVHDALRSAGGILWLTPRILVHQARHLRMPHVLRERFEHGRLYAATRVARSRASIRGIFALGSLALPALIAARLALRLLPRARTAGPFLRAFPAILLLGTAWSAGELSGYVTPRRARATRATSAAHREGSGPAVESIRESRSRGPVG